MYLLGIDSNSSFVVKSSPTKYVPNYNDYEMFLFYLVANCLNAKCGTYVQIICLSYFTRSMHNKQV